MGRLDKDTEGLLIVTNDGELAHRLLSPKNHVEKKYFVRLDGTVDESYRAAMAQGIEIGEKHPTRQAKLEILSECECYLTITEGKFHQVKRMFERLGRKVVYLKRVKMGNLELDENLESGAWRFLSEEEIRSLRNGES
jgi:16S rRNA pseudouridine516 synthase